MVSIELAAEDQAAAEEFAGRMFAAHVASLELATVELGVRLGLYAALAEGPMTCGELATAAGIVERYAREWLEQQAVAGVLRVDEPPGRRRSVGSPCRGHTPMRCSMMTASPA